MHVWNPCGTARLGNTANRWTETSIPVMQNGVVGAEELGTVPDTRQVTQTLSPPIRVKAAPSRGIANRTPDCGGTLI